MDAEASAVLSIRTIMRKSYGSEALAGNNRDVDAQTAVCLIDHSCDNVSDIDLNDVPAQLEQTLKQGLSDTKSLFNVNIEEFTTDLSSVRDELAVYEQKIKQEQLNWIDFVVNTTRSGQAKDVSDSTLQLKEEHYMYLNNGPNLRTSVRSSLAFLNGANLFLIKMKNIEIITDNLLEHCTSVVNSKKSQAITTNLSRRN